MMQITLARTELLLGDVLAGEAAWELERAPAWLEVRLLWLTRGKGTQDAAVADTKRIERPAADGREGFQFVLPDAPCSFSGKLISLVWAVELVAADEGGVARAEFVLSPTGSEIVLGETPDHGAGWNPAAIRIPK